MSAFNENKPVIKQGAQGEYYEVGRCKYTGTFPYEWATDHKSLDDSVYPSGPEWCGNCRDYSSINGVFVFYCANCVNVYDDIIHPKRNGCIYAHSDELLTDEKLWEACPYMRGIPRSQIGDKVAEKVENQELTEKERYWSNRARYWDAYYDENGRSIFDEGFREPGEATIEEHQDHIQGEIDAYYSEKRNQDYYGNDYYCDYYEEEDPYSEEYRISTEMAQLPADMREAFDPEYQEELADFRAAAIEY